MGQPDGQHALVTGATAGIGLAIAQRFVDEGAHVVVTGREQATLDEALAQLGPRAMGVRGDAASRTTPAGPSTWWPRTAAVAARSRSSR